MKSHSEGGGSEIRWKRRECASAEVDGSLVLLDLESLAYHALNSTAAAAWQAMETPATLSAISAVLVRQFEVDPAHCQVSVQSLLAALEQKGLVRQAPVPA